MQDNLAIFSNYSQQIDLLFTAFPNKPPICVSIAEFTHRLIQSFSWEEWDCYLIFGRESSLFRSFVQSLREI